MRRYGDDGTFRTELGNRLSCAASFRRRDNSGGVKVFGNFYDGLADRFRRRRRRSVFVLVGRRRKLAFREHGYAGHRFYGFDRIHAAGRFAAEHNGVRAVEDSVGDVARFRAGRAGIIAHRFQHLRRRNDRLAGCLAFVNEHLLQRRHFFCRHFDAQIAAGYHDAVAHLDDFVDIVNGSLTFDLGNDLHRAVVFFQNLADRHDVLAALDKGSGDPVHIHADAEFNVCGVRFRNGRQIDGDARHGDALAVAHLAAVEDLRMDILAFDADDFQVYQAVGQEDMVAGLYVLRQLFIIYGNDRFVAFDVAGRQGKFLAFFHLDGAVFKLAEADFRALRIEKQGYGNAYLFRSGADHVHARLVFFVGTVGKIKAGDVHAGLNHLFDDFLGIRARAESADNFRFFQHA